MGPHLRWLSIVHSSAACFFFFSYRGILTKVVQVLLEATTIHKDIVEVYNYVLTEYTEEYLVHQPLES